MRQMNKRKRKMKKLWKYYNKKKLTIHLISYFPFCLLIATIKKRGGKKDAKRESFPSRSIREKKRKNKNDREKNLCRLA